MALLCSVLTVSTPPYSNYRMLVDRLSVKDVYLVALPMKIAKGSGGSIRIITASISKYHPDRGF